MYILVTHIIQPAVGSSHTPEDPGQRPERAKNIFSPDSDSDMSVHGHGREDFGLFMSLRTSWDCMVSPIHGWNFYGLFFVDGFLQNCDNNGSYNGSVKALPLQNEAVTG